ncbi:MAG: hypothetical protein LBQ91_04415 [Oscillospiraceae bacterium]|jgi:2-isopropylmalate synthase|nr:hypothetical protein [Oscillospiraceae bacterium]
MQTTPEYRMFDFVITTGNTIKSTATITLGGRLGKTVKTRYGDGPIDAAYDAINKCVRIDLSRGIQNRTDAEIKEFWKRRDFKLTKFDIAAIGEGSATVGKTTVTITYEGTSATGEGVDNDIVYSAIKAYIEAVNELVPAIRADAQAWSEGGSK